MRIAQIAPLYERVPPVHYGGTERVVSYLTEELVRLGHDVTLFASGDSQTTARLRGFRERALRSDRSCVDPLAVHLHMLGEAYDQAGEFDVIHCHADYLCLPMARLVETPTVLTLHGRLDMPELAPLYRTFDDVPLVSISDAQRVPLPNANWVATVHHGLPRSSARESAQEEYLLFLGRISPEKCPDVAIRVARAAGARLRIAAKVDPVDDAYFAEVIRPLLDDPQIEFIGEVSEDEKADLLARSSALLFPIDWPEPFGLVMIESLACGTPVIARRRGSVPEILEHGRTAWLAETEDEMVEAVHRIDELDRRECRAEFERRFTAERMALDYVRVYESILSNAQRGVPKTCVSGADPGQNEPRQGSSAG